MNTIKVNQLRQKIVEVSIQLLNELNAATFVQSFAVELKQGEFPGMFIISYHPEHVELLKALPLSAETVDPHEGTSDFEN